MRTQRFSVDTTAALSPRKLPPTTGLIVAHEVHARRDSTMALIPDGHEDTPAMRQLIARCLDAIHRPAQELLSLREGDNSDTVTIAAPPEVLAIITEAQSRSRGALNLSEDNLVNILRDSVSMGKRKKSDHDHHKAALTLEAAWFSDGAWYLAVDSRIQWFEVDIRLRRSGVAVQRAAASLGVDDTLSEIRTINDYFGLTMGLVGPLEKLPVIPDPSAQSTALNDALLSALTQLVSLANTLWPGDSDEAISNRLWLAGPYLQALSDQSDRMTRPSSPTGDAPGDVDTEDDQPTT